MPLDNALIISAAPIFFTSYGFHGSIPSLVKYMEGDVRGLRIAIVAGSAITLVGYILWQLSTHGVLSQSEFTQILKEKPTLYGLIEACRHITGSEIIEVHVARYYYRRAAYVAAINRAQQALKDDRDRKSVV